MKHVAGLALCAALALGCGDRPAEQAPKAAAPVEAPVAPAPDGGAGESETPYSPEKAAALLAELEGCQYEFNCEAYRPLVAFGEKVQGDLVALALDETRPRKGREVALQALGEMRARGVAARLHAAARQEEDFSLRRALYAAVGETGAGDAAVFEALKAEYLAIDRATRRIPVADALARFPEALAWATSEFGRDPEKETAFANVIDKVAAEGDLAAVQGAIGRATNPMARHRLAAKAIELGDQSRFPVFLDGLASENAFDRSDAANMLSRVVEGLPGELRPKAVELLRAAKARDGGGLTSIGYEKCLKALGAG